jgi:RNA polymerase sigma factor (sigma-70 family)
MPLSLAPPPPVVAGRVRGSAVPAARRPAERHLDRLLAASAGRGETPASVVQRLTVRIRAVARAHRLNAHDVEDVVQLTWLRVLEHGDAIRDPAALPAWLHTTARRESLRVLREGARLQLVGDEPIRDEEPCPSVQAQLERREQRAALFGAIRRLSGRQRTLMLALLADPAPSYERLARTLEMPVGSIGPTRIRGMERLRRDRHLVAVADLDDAA